MQNQIVNSYLTATGTINHNMTNDYMFRYILQKNEKVLRGLISSLLHLNPKAIKHLGATSNEGYHNKTTDFRSYFLSFDDDVRLEIMNKPGMSDDTKVLARTGYIHLAFSVGSKEQVDELTVKLKADGYEVVSGPRTTGDGYYESCIIGIEGNQIEITI